MNELELTKEEINIIFWLNAWVENQLDIATIGHYTAKSKAVGATLSDIMAGNDKVCGMSHCSLESIRAGVDRLVELGYVKPETKYILADEVPV